VILRIEYAAETQKVVSGPGGKRVVPRSGAAQRVLCTGFRLPINLSTRERRARHLESGDESVASREAHANDQGLVVRVRSCRCGCSRVRGRRRRPSRIEWRIDKNKEPQRAEYHVGSPVFVGCQEGGLDIATCEECAIRVVADDLEVNEARNPIDLPGGSDFALAIDGLVSNHRSGDCGQMHVNGEEGHAHGLPVGAGADRGLMS
jgi:hypothetical protein